MFEDGPYLGNTGSPSSQATSLSPQEAAYGRNAAVWGMSPADDRLIWGQPDHKWQYVAAGTPFLAAPLSSATWQRE